MVEKKYIIKTFLLILTLLFLFDFSYVFADDIDYEENSNNLDDFSYEVSNISESSLNLNSRSCVVIDRKSKYILYGKNENKKVKMASTTKIMTALLVIENMNLDTTVEVSKKAANTGGSRLGLKTGDKITIKNLLYGLMLCSGNDAAVALAETVSGSVENFAVLMNKKANDLGLKNTNFETPHGLDSDNHYTTAYELAILSDYALNNSTFKQIVGTKYYTININGYSKNLSNTNELLGNLDGVYGIKTGFTNGANRCLVTAFKRNEMDIICVVLGADTKNLRTKDSIKLIEYTFKTFTYINLKTKIDEGFNHWIANNSNLFYIEKGITQNINLYISAPSNPIIPIKKDEINDIEIIYDINMHLSAPISSDTKIGTLNVLLNNSNIDHCNVHIKNNIDKKNILFYLNDFILNYKNSLSSLF